MQAGVHPMFVPLKLTHDDALFQSAPPGVDGAAIRQALATAFDQTPDEDTDWPATRRKRVFALAARTLLDNPNRLAEAIHLTRAGAPDLADTAPMAHVRLVALWRSGNRAGTIEEADRILGMSSHSVAERQTIRATLRSWNLESQMTSKIEYLKDFWPDPTAATLDPLGTIQPTGPYPLSNRVGPTLAQLNKCKPEEKSAFLEDLGWGCELHRRMIYLSRIAPSIQRKQAADRTPDEITALAIHSELKSKIRPPDLSPVIDNITAGRSIVLLQAHAGLSTVYPMGLPHPDIPYSTISTKSEPSSRPQDFNLAANGSNVMRDFAKLAKLTRKSPRLVRVFPDGGFGEMMEITVCGQPVKIGRGAATLAWLGKTMTYFSRSVRSDDGFHFTLQPGPMAFDYRDQEAFDRDFGSFYARCLEDIIYGAPHDMAPNGGIWSHIIQK